MWDASIHFMEIMGRCAQTPETFLNFFRNFFLPCNKMPRRRIIQVNGKTPPINRTGGIEYEKELEKLNLERNSLLLQVSPHMLLNSLNMIYSLSLSKNHLAIQKFTYNLMQYFRYVLRENREFVTLQEELEFIQSYLGIQKMRYPDRFTYVYQMEDDLRKIMIPPFLIENFVENAIKYGLMPDRVVEIILSIRREDDMLCISLIDTGNGMDEQRLLALNNGSVIEDEAGKHIGIWNCRKRIQMYFGKDADLHFTSTLHQGTQVWMALPYKELDVNQD